MQAAPDAASAASAAFASVPAMVLRQAAAHPFETIMRRKDRGIWKAITWAELAGHVQQIGTAVLAGQLGCGDVAAIISETRPEAAYADLAIQGAGAASIVIHPDEAPDRIQHILRAGGCRLAFVEGEEQLDKVLTVRGQCPALSRIVIFDMKGLREYTDPGCMSLAAFVNACPGQAGWTASVDAVVPEQPAVVLFPRQEASPTGRTLSHREVLRMIAGTGSAPSLRPLDERLAVLRMADVTERIWGLYLALQSRCVSNYLESPETAVENLQELQPTVLGADADAWGHLHERAARSAKAATQVQRRAYGWALRGGRAGGAAAALAHFFVLSAVRRELGLGKLRLAYVAGSLPGPAAVDWARSLGIAIQRVDEPAVGEGQPDARFQALMQEAHA